MAQNPIGRFSHVPTPPTSGGTAEDSQVDIQTHTAIGNGGFWPNASSSSDHMELLGREDESAD